jgi:hypothetical protein
MHNTGIWRKLVWLQIVQSDDKEGDHVKRCEVWWRARMELEFLRLATETNCRWRTY